MKGFDKLLSASSEMGDPDFLSGRSLALQTLRFWSMMPQHTISPSHEFPLFIQADAWMKFQLVDGGDNWNFVLVGAPLEKPVRIYNPFSSTLKGVIQALQLSFTKPFIETLLDWVGSKFTSQPSLVDVIGKLFTATLGFDWWDFVDEILVLSPLTKFQKTDMAFDILDQLPREPLP